MHQEDVCSVGITRSLVFSTNQPMFQGEVDSDKCILQILVVMAWPEKFTMHVVCLEMMDAMDVLHLLESFTCFICLRMSPSNSVLFWDI